MADSKIQFRAQAGELGVIDAHAQRLADATAAPVTRRAAARDIVRRFGAAIDDGDPWQGGWTSGYAEGRRAGWLAMLSRTGPDQE